MLPAMHRRIVLYGYGYTGRFLKWYAEYYHSINVDYVISLDMSSGQSYEEEIYRPSFLGFDYKDSMSALLWLAVPMDEKLRRELESHGFFAGDNLVDFYQIIYGDDVTWEESCEQKAVHKRKTGTRDIQFLEWLEWKYKCNFVTAVQATALSVTGNSYRVTSQKEIFTILDRCHLGGDIGEGIFDFGCGKGGGMVAFCDYGFKKIGGVEQDPDLYELLVDNMQKIGINKVAELECIKGDATSVREVLDKYSWFYFFDPFGNDIFKKCVCNICESVKRKKRKVHIIFINPHCYKVMENMRDFRLTNQFIVAVRQKVVSVWESI